MVHGPTATDRTGRRRWDPGAAKRFFKIVRSEREALLRAQRREIFALSRLDHPGIVGILDAGHDAGLLYCAMDLVEGPTLGPWARTLARGTAVDTRVLDVVASLAATLASLHGEGLVHRDLKPENVIITSTGAPVLVDFGLATRFPGGEGRESVGAEGGVAGTLTYLAPEVLDGELVDARSDLYALGCILYELLAGAPPFEGTPRVVARAHRERVPEPPSARIAGLDARLDALVGWLLAKRPRERVAYAADVSRELEEMGAKVAWPVTTAPRPYLHRSHLVARDGEIAQVERALERARHGAGGLISIAGPSGIGESRLDARRSDARASLGRRPDGATHRGHRRACAVGRRGVCGARSRDRRRRAQGRDLSARRRLRFGHRRAAQAARARDGRRGAALRTRQAPRGALRGPGRHRAPRAPCPGRHGARA